MTKYFINNGHSQTIKSVKICESIASIQNGKSSNPIKLQENSCKEVLQS